MSLRAHKSSEVQETKIPSHQRSRKIMNVTVYFLDDSSHVFQLQAKNLGQVLFDKVCKHINLLEVDYFGLECEDEKGSKFWLDVLKPLCSQLPTSFPSMYFCVKFYTPDPVQLEDEFTRYLFGLQIKKDLMSGALQCNDNTAAVLVSYIVQADLGDFNPDKCIDHSYLSSYKFVPFQDAELERKIMENHKKIIGQTPAEADLNLLETARRCELYGIKMTPAKDQEGVPLNLAVAHLGVLVFQNFTKINTFSWVKIRKLSFKRKKFLIKLHPEGYGYYKDTVEFSFEGRNECKNFWKKCIENHTFFRCSDAKQGMRLKPKIFSRGSSFRYSGRTQKQVSEFVREQCFKRSPFQRSTSLKTPTSPSRSIGSSIIPQPLLPVTSLSCGSISDVSKEAISPPKATSEPSTPHTAPDFAKATNGSCSKTPETPVSGVVSPESDQEGFQSPDFCTQDTDDNLSHDSYHVLEKEAQPANPASVATNLSDNKVLQPFSNNKEDNEKENKESVVTELSAYHSSPQSVKTVENNNNNTAVNVLEGNSVINNNNKLESSLTNLQPVKQELNNSSNSMHIPNHTSTEHFPDDKCVNRLCQNHQSGELGNIIGQKSLDQLSLSNNSFKNLSQECFDGETDNSVKDSEQNFGASTFYVSSPYAVRLSNKKRVLNDKAYCLTKELLMTERTYRKDLEIVNVVFRDEFNCHTNIHSEAVEQILDVFDPLYELHCSLLRDLEQRLAFWEGRPVNKNHQAIKGVADILLQQKGMIKVHSTYLEKLPQLLEQLYQDLHHNQSLAQLYQQFESQKVCYLPLTSFLLRATFRILYYSSLLKSLLNIYNSEHVDYNNCINMLEELKEFCENFETMMLPLVNYTKLIELEHNLIGFSSLVDTKREFIREGCLSKFTKNGSHQHMFFLFSDVLLYTVRVHDGQLRFKVQGQLPCECLKIQETEPKLGINHCFILCNPEKHLLLASPSTGEHAKWMRDLQKTIQKAKMGLSSNRAPSRESSISSFDEKFESGDEDAIILKDEKPVSHHINTSIHICWHRNISISCNDLFLSMKNSLSGYLLRKFKNSSGWQKVWVVLANLCLFFYRSYLDESPLASLPLAGYRIMNTSSTDLISGDCIFKLVFKNHEYFFMVENRYSFERWMEAIHGCTLMEEENTHL